MTKALKHLILENAAQQLVDSGGSGLTVRKLAFDSETTTQAIYTLFGGKDGIVIALFEEGWRRLLEKLNEVPTSPDPIEHLISIGHCYVRFARENVNFYELMIGRSLSGISVPKRETLHAEPWLRVARGAIQRAIDERFLTGTADAIGAMLWAATHGFIDLTLNDFISVEDDEAFLRQIAAGVFSVFSNSKSDLDELTILGRKKPFERI